jgi:hypothetical protein
VAFSSSETCEAARLKVIKDAERVKQDLFERYRQSDVPAEAAAVNALSVLAVCVDQ